MVGLFRILTQVTNTPYSYQVLVRNLNVWVPFRSVPSSSVTIGSGESPKLLGFPEQIGEERSVIMWEDL